MTVGTAVALSGCASGGGGGGGGGEEEGFPPRENDDTRSAELFLTQAETLGDPSRFQNALTAAMAAILDDSTNPLGYYQAGRAQVGLGDHVAADTLFEMATELYPAYDQDVRIQRETAWIALFNAAIDPLDTGDSEEGIRFLQSAEVIFPGQRPEALINLAVTYNQVGRIDDAIEAFGAALDIIRGPRMQEADSVTAASWAESEMNVSFNRAMLLSQEGRYDEAIGEYERFLEGNPGDVAALSSLASVLSEAGMADSAQAIYDNLLTGAAELGMRELFNIGVGLYGAASSASEPSVGQELFGRAADAFRQVAEVAPENRDAVFNLAQSLYEAGNWEELIPVARELLDLDGYNPDSYTILAQGLVETDQSQEAVQILQTREGLAFRIEESSLAPRTAGGGSVSGQLVNNTLDPGTVVTIRVHFNGEDGAEVGAIDIRVTAPAQGAAELFRADLTSDESVLGYYYEVVSPG
ncbi:MAG: tetratricopeptide repeat protein [Gemmatimonadota bacterium]|nr:tetratricopeptide repeat protein [Gemmatimonadota bacterium]